MHTLIRYELYGYDASQVDAVVDAMTQLYESTSGCTHFLSVLRALAKAPMWLSLPPEPTAPPAPAPTAPLAVAARAKSNVDDDDDDEAEPKAGHDHSTRERSGGTGRLKNDLDYDDEGTARHKKRQKYAGVIFSNSCHPDEDQAERTELIQKILDKFERTKRTKRQKEADAAEFVRLVKQEEVWEGERYDDDNTFDPEFTENTNSDGVNLRVLRETYQRQGGSDSGGDEDSIREGERSGMRCAERRPAKGERDQHG